MTWDPVTKRALIADYVDNYFPNTEKAMRESISGMSQSTLETERAALTQSLERQPTLGANAQKDITRLRMMEFVTQCHTMTLDPGDDRDAQRRMHQTLQTTANGMMPQGQPNASLKHENRMGERTNAIKARDTVTFKVN